MNKKGFTLLEIILSIIIMGLIVMIAAPSISNIINSSKIKEAETIEKMLVKNLELYNSDNENSLWCEKNNENNTSNCITVGSREVTIDELSAVNSSIKMGNCLINKDEGLIIKKDIGGSYSYAAHIICSKDFKSNSTKVATDKDMNNKNIYYKTK